MSDDVAGNWGLWYTKTSAELDLSTRVTHMGAEEIH
jgi:hypothetical protein